MWNRRYLVRDRDDFRVWVEVSWAELTRPDGEAFRGIQIPFTAADRTSQ